MAYLAIYFRAYTKIKNKTNRETPVSTANNKLSINYLSFGSANIETAVRIMNNSTIAGLMPAKTIMNIEHIDDMKNAAIIAFSFPLP